MARRVNDIGGRTTGPIERTEAEVKYWEAQVDAIRRVLGNNIVSLDEQRRATEEMTPETYDQLDFFERRLEAMVRVLTEKGIVNRQQLEKRILRYQNAGRDLEPIRKNT